MTLSRSSLGKIETPETFEIDENIIIQETNVEAEASLTTTTYIIHSPARTHPRTGEDLAEILSYLNIRRN